MSRSGSGTTSRSAPGFTHRLRFPGQIYDIESNLHSNGHRDYDPRLGRYVESDPIGLEGGINTYAYAGNDPVNAIDPLGLDPKSNESNACRAAAGGNAAGGGGVIAIPAPSGLGGAGAAEGAGLGAALLSTA
jgi:RHS repeat-associated protein